jgi:hypothetical protein
MYPAIAPKMIKTIVAEKAVPKSMKGFLMK